MKDSNFKLLEIFSCLSAEEQKVFNKQIVRSHSPDSDIVKLVNALYKNRKKLSIGNLLSTIKANQFGKATAKNFSNLMSKTKKELEEWMICYDLMQSKYDSKLALIKSYNKRGIYDEANREAKQLETKISSETKYDLEKTRSYHLLKYYQYYSDNPIKYESGYKLLEELVVGLDSFYKERRLLYTAELHNWGRIQNHDYKELITNNFDRNANVIDTEQITVLESIEALCNDYSHEAFEEVSQLLFDNKMVSNSMLETLCCEYCINTAIKFVRNKTMRDVRVLVKLYEYGLDSGVLLSEGKLTIRRFYSMISALSLISSFEEVEKFIDDRIHLVNSNNLETTRRIANAQNCFNHERYQEILGELRGLKYEDKYQRFRAMRYELVAMYEEGHYDLLDTSLHNFSRTIRRNSTEISKETYGININLIKVLNYLMKDDKAAIKFLLESGQSLVFRKWTEEKIK